jgi:UDP-N-acetyl-D-mannosaminuronate dehydrogenase
VIGYDVDEEKIRNLGNNNNTKQNIEFTTDPAQINQADFVLICVPTPVTKSKEPDLSYIKLFRFTKTFTKKCFRNQQPKLLDGT